MVWSLSVRSGAVVPSFTRSSHPLAVRRRRAPARSAQRGGGSPGDGVRSPSGSVNDASWAGAGDRGPEPELDGAPVTVDVVPGDPDAVVGAVVPLAPPDGAPVVAEAGTDVAPAPEPALDVVVVDSGRK